MARVHVDPPSPDIDAVTLTADAHVPDATRTAFVERAIAATESCPVANALADGFVDPRVEKFESDQSSSTTRDDSAY